MDAMTKRAAYFAAFKQHAAQLNTYRHALEWYRLDPPGRPGPGAVTAEEAAAWANLGYLARDAFPLIVQGITPDMAAAGDDALVAEHGVIGAAVLKLQLEEPGATVLVDPDVTTEETREMAEGDRRSHLRCFCHPHIGRCGWRLGDQARAGGQPKGRLPACGVCVRLWRDAVSCVFCGCRRGQECGPCRSTHAEDPQ